jgi:hypothetical protein
MGQLSPDWLFFETIVLVMLNNVLSKLFCLIKE